MITALLSHPGVLDVIAGIAIAAITVIGRKILRLLDSAWAESYIAGADGHLRDAAAIGTMEFAARMRAAGSDGVITGDERRAARDAAIHAAENAVDRDRLARALGLSRGRTVDRDMVDLYVALRVDRALAEIGLVGSDVATDDSSTGMVEPEEDIELDDTVPGDQSRSR